MSTHQENSHDGIISSGVVADRGLAQSIPCGSVESDSRASIQVVKQGDVIQSIQIHCGCGEIIQVMCDYE